MPQVKEDQLIAEAYEENIGINKHNDHPEYGPDDIGPEGKVWAEITIMGAPNVQQKTIIAIDPKQSLNKQVYSKFPHATGYKLGSYGAAFHKFAREMGDGLHGSLD